MIGSMNISKYFRKNAQCRKTHTADGTLYASKKPFESWNTRITEYRKWDPLVNYFLHSAEIVAQCLKKDKTRDPLTRQGFAKIFIPRHTWNKTVCSSYFIGCMNKLATWTKTVEKWTMIMHCSLTEKTSHCNTRAHFLIKCADWNHGKC